MFLTEPNQSVKWDQQPYVPSKVVRMKLRLLLNVFLFVATISPAGWLVAQDDEMETINRIVVLQKQLESGKISERDAAQKELIAIGPLALDYLDPPTDDTTTDARERLAKIRKVLETKAAESIANASKLTLVGEMTVQTALETIEKKTGNKVVCEFPQILERTVKLSSEDVEFWKVMEELLSKTGLIVDAYGGEANQIKLIPAQSQNPQAPADKREVPTAYAKIFQLQASSVVSSMNLSSPEQSYTDLSLRVRWEPRLRPISVDMPMSSVKVEDEFGDEVKISQPDRVVYGMVQPELPEVEFNLRLPRIDRQIEQLESITARIDAVLPGRVESFRFKNLSEQKKGRKIQKGGATVTYGGIRKNEDLWSIIVSLSFEEENNALESHQGWVFQNPVYLQNDKGEKEESIGSETMQQDNSMVTIKYFFLKEPKNRTLVYKTPSAIVKMPVDIKLVKIPMP